MGIGVGKAKETLPARDKAIRKAKLNIIKVKRGCSGFDCACSELHTIPVIHHEEYTRSYKEVRRDHLPKH